MAINLFLFTGLYQKHMQKHCILKNSQSFFFNKNLIKFCQKIYSKDLVYEKIFVYWVIHNLHMFCLGLGVWYLFIGFFKIIVCELLSLNDKKVLELRLITVNY